MFHLICFNQTLAVVLWWSCVSVERSKVIVQLLLNSITKTQTDKGLSISICASSAAGHV